MIKALALRISPSACSSVTTPTARLTIEQVRSAVNTWLSAVDLKPKARIARYKHELKNQAYYQRRNVQARKSHTTTRLKRLRVYGIDPDRIKSCLTAKSPPIKMAC